MYKVTDIQRFCIHDGPGVRTTVFLHGCPLRCTWCHNPETANGAPHYFFDAQACINCGACAEACAHGTHIGERDTCVQCGHCAAVCPTNAIAATATSMSGEAIVQTALRDAAYYSNGGGVTLSGGEPLMDFAKAVQLLTLLKEANLHTCVETSGTFAASEAELQAFAAVCGHVLFDVKDSDAERLYANTGARLDVVLNNLRALDSLGVSTTIRAVLLGFNANEAHAKALAKLHATLPNCTGIDLIPYHPYGNGKAERLGLPREEHADWPVTAEAINAFTAHLAANGYNKHTPS